jgi:hypothetical protein
MIIYCYNYKLNSFILNILYTFSPLLHFGNSVNLDSALSCVLLSPVNHVVTIGGGLYFSKLTVLTVKKYYTISANMISNFMCQATFTSG